MKNARAMADAGAATVLPEKDLNSDNLRTEILRILGKTSYLRTLEKRCDNSLDTFLKMLLLVLLTGDDVLRKRMRSSALEMAAPNAAKELAQHILSLTS